MTPGDDVSRETKASETAATWRNQVSRALGNSLPPVTWQTYQDYVSHARHEYLAAVQIARQRREAATGPAFEEFAAAERAAWFDYHEASRRAWLAYQENQRTQPPEPFPTPRDVHPYPMSDESALSVGLPLRGYETCPCCSNGLARSDNCSCREPCGVQWCQAIDPGPPGDGRTAPGPAAAAARDEWLARNPAFGYLPAAHFTPKPESER